MVGFQGKARKESSNMNTTNLSKLGVMSIAKLKPKKKHKNKNKKKKSTVKSEKVTTVKKETGTFEKVTNFIKSLGKATSSQICRAGFPANRQYLNSRASISILFNNKLLNKIDKLPQAAHVKAGGSDIKLSKSKGGALHHNLASLPLPAEGYYYDEKALTNLLSLACIVNEYWVRMDTRIDDAIYVQSKTGGRSIRFQ